MYLKISEPISLTGSAGGRAKTKPPFRPPRPKAEAKSLPRSEREAFYYWGQTAKEPEKMSARTLFWSEAGFSLFLIGLNSYNLLSYL